MANTKTRKRKRRITLAALGCVALGALAFIRHKDPAIAVQQEAVAVRNLTELVVAPGKVQPVTQVKLSPEVSGEIIALPFKEGQPVKQGDVLIKIKPDPYVASKNSAEANYKYAVANQHTAEANLEKAKLDFDQNEELFKHKLISESDRQTSKTAYDVAQANLLAAGEQVDMAKAELDKAADDLSKCIIYSPITGTVTKLYSQVGERVVGTATMAGTDIMIVSDLTEMEARVDVGEGDVVLIKPGQTARLEVDALKDRDFKGIVTDIANSSNNSDTSSTSGGSSSSTSSSSSSSSTEATKFQVKIRIQEKEAFRPGMSVTADIETRSRTNALTVPIQSITSRAPAMMTNGRAGGATSSAVIAGQRRAPEDFRKQIPVVFVIEGDHVKMAPVKTGISDDNYEEITDGLKAGQQVVSGSSKAIKELEDGKKIVVEAAKPGWGAVKTY